MSLRHILLGMLDRPASGYDLKKRFNQSLRHFWQAELSQIYPQLQKLESEGLLASREGQVSKGPPPRIYKRTAKGRRALFDWLAEGPQVSQERIGYLAQVQFLDTLEDADRILAFMQTLRDHMADWLEQLHEAERCWKAEDPRYPDALPDKEFYAQLTLSMGLVKVQANLDWCEASIRRIRRRRDAR